MSDDNPTPVANATVALAIQTLKDEIGGVRKQVRALWIAVVVALVLIVVLSGFAILPRFFGVRVPGGFPGRQGGFQDRQGGFQDRQGGFQGGPGQEGQQVPQQPGTTP